MKIGDRKTPSPTNATAFMQGPLLLDILFMEFLMTLFRGVPERSRSHEMFRSAHGFKFAPGEFISSGLPGREITNRRAV